MRTKANEIELSPHARFFDTHYWKNSKLAARRAGRLERFIEAQLSARQWLCFKDIVELHVRDIHGFEKEREANALFSRFYSAIVAGRFDHEGRCLIRDLNPARFKRLNALQVEMTPEGPGGRASMQYWWLPRTECERWYRRENLKWPFEFEVKPTSASTSSLCHSVGAASAQSQSPNSASKNRELKKRGRKPVLHESIKGRILADLASGKRSTSDVEGDTLEALCKDYGGSRNTADRARDEALAKFRNEFLTIVEH